ncbi:selenium metabolism protein YedF [Lacrimispora xylanisolvens]|uniref:Selenium metabolism protein YedF n=1 Tax=Lacrimispora xylanisolvens TaxID=384636 RepID=A0A2S6HXI4_9FIRM|nr:sulfurtransferase-like selenium metabolism protein YedF [Hungatella xylanolytica]PPK82721.1 selenium metabolism protein YedF [Hungatella xylanolytica]
MKIIDAMGKACPVPVVLAKKAAAELASEGGELQVLVDNQPACENLRNMAEGNGYAVMEEKIEPGRYRVTITVPVQEQAQVQSVTEQTPVKREESGLVVVISKDSMGQGSEELGKILIKGFLFSLTQLKNPPKAVLFFNSGVLLTVEGCNTLDDLRELEQAGTQIEICGTCADYYSVKDSIGVGKIVNMMTITERMAYAGSVINI